jgi:hypothetical protein
MFDRPDANSDHGNVEHFYSIKLRTFSISEYVRILIKETTYLLTYFDFPNLQPVSNISSGMSSDQRNTAGGLAFNF